MAKEIIPTRVLQSNFSRVELPNIKTYAFIQEHYSAISSMFQHARFFLFHNTKAKALRVPNTPNPALFSPVLYA